MSISFRSLSPRFWRPILMKRASITSVFLVAMLLLDPSGVIVPAEARNEPLRPSAPVASHDSSTQPLKTATGAKSDWQVRLDSIAHGKNVGISVRLNDSYLYNYSSRKKRTPASNEKLLMSMALFDYVDPSETITTLAAAKTVTQKKVVGHLWLVGSGDPSVTGGGPFGRDLPFPPTRISAIARKIKRSGVKRITGSVKGAINYFAHDWWAPGWKDDFPEEEVGLPSALSIDANTAHEKHIADPEVRAARSLTKRLRSLGVRVAGPPGAGSPPGGLEEVASIESTPVLRMARFMNRNSINFFAEMFGKRLSVETSGAPGTIAGGAGAIQSWAASHGVTLKAYDSSGLSYSNRVSPRGLVQLLDDTTAATWFGKLRSTLAGGGQGTLLHRLQGVRVRAKTGTLDGYSALSGYVYLEHADAWASFSILSQGMAKSTASDMEDAIVSVLENRAH